MDFVLFNQCAFQLKPAMITAVLACGLAGAQAQTVTVAKSGSPSFSTIQAAIDSFASDSDPAANVIQITDSELYDEVITINRPLTLEGTGATRPRLALQGNAGGGALDGLYIALPAGTTTGTVALKDLILLPSTTNTPANRALRTGSANMFLHLDNILIAPAIANEPASTDGLTEVDVSGATHFGDDGMFIGSANGLEEAGFEALFKDVIITHMRGASTSCDGIVASNAGTEVFRKYTFLDGCVISFCKRAGAQLNGDIIVETPEDRMIIMNNGTHGLWFVSGAANTRSVNGLNSLNNGQFGVLVQGIGVNVALTIKNAIVVSNGISNIDLGSSSGVAQPVLIENVTLADHGPDDSPIAISGGVEANVTIRNSIIAGDGSEAGANTILNNLFGYTLTLEGVATVTEGPFKMTTAVGGAGTTNGTPTTTADPQFAETTNVADPDFFDVTNTAYATANATGGPLGGGADYAGSTSVSEWSLY